MARRKSFDVVIVGAGPAGIGTAIALQKAGCKNFVLLERDCVGASFRRWPKEMRFISPSFTGNFFGMPDMNAVSPDTSPAFTLQTEHPSGDEYADYLEVICRHFNLPIEAPREVVQINPIPQGWQLETPLGKMVAKMVVWAAGEFQYPAIKPFPGAELGMHIGHIRSYGELKGKEFVIVGGYESGFDIAAYLLQRGIRVTICDRTAPWECQESDSSLSLSPYTRDRIRPYLHSRNLQLIAAHVEHISFVDQGYRLQLTNRRSLFCLTRPLLASGFRGSVTAIANWFEWIDGRPLLTEKDESTLAPGLFLTGPQVAHEKAIFCFIYKFRQRFPVIAMEICERLGLSDARAALDEYRLMNMWLDDLSCCAQECAC